MDIAMGIQRPGQNKEQTKLIARGIEQGISQYKKRLGAKERELDKGLKQLERAASAAPVAKDSVLAQRTECVRDKRPWLAWTLLVATWLGIAAFALRSPLI